MQVTPEAKKLLNQGGILPIFVPEGKKRRRRNAILLSKPDGGLWK